MQLELSDIVKILNRIEILEKTVDLLKKQVEELSGGKKCSSDRPAFPVGNVSEKYKGLAEYLYERWDKKIELNYTDIEEILGFPLPPTAYSFPQSYWANTETHSYASSWLAVGYKAKVLGVERVVFERNLYLGR